MEKLIQHCPARQSTMTEDLMAPDQAGLWSVCLPLRLCPTQNSQELTAMFSQAGDVKRLHFTNSLVFVRYASKRDALLATELFSDLDVHIANNQNKGNKQVKSEEAKATQNNVNNIKSSENNNRKSKNRQKKYRCNKRKLHQDMDDCDHDGDNGNDKHVSELEKIFGAFSVDGHFANQDSHNEGSCSKRTAEYLAQPSNISREVRLNGAAVKTDSSELGQITLFVGNIESEDNFKEMIRPYHPISVDIKSKRSKIYAFVNMSTEENAQRVIRDLHNKRQKNKILLVDYDRFQVKNDSDTLSDTSSIDRHSHTHSKIWTGHRMPHLEREFADMPPLIHISQLESDEDSYVDCCLFVANFPKNILDSTLRTAFSKYHVIDVCMINNGSAPGSTKAFLYLATVYDVIQAVVDMNKSDIFGYPLKVNVPYKNHILKAFVEKELSKRQDPQSPQASNYSSS